jgi:ActR/RegA family two-component response regulator/DNA-binding CsgD family transcriptional regulator
VLLVDDDLAVRETLARALVGEGYEVEQVSSIATAIDVVRTRAQRYRAAVVDLKLADGLALSVLRELRMPPHPVATVVLSGLGVTEAAQIALSEGAYQLLHKPCSPDEVARMVAGAVERTSVYRRWLAGTEATADPEMLPRRGAITLPLDQPRLVRFMADLVIEAGGLSAAEARLVEPLMLGYEYVEVGRRVGVSLQTVRTHVKMILAKLGIDSVRSLWRVSTAQLERRAFPVHEVGRPGGRPTRVLSKS